MSRSRQHLKVAIIVIAVVLPGDRTVLVKYSSPVSSANRIRVSRPGSVEI